MRRTFMSLPRDVFGPNGRRGPSETAPLVMESRDPKGADAVGIWDENGVFEISAPWGRISAYECSPVGPGGMLSVTACSHGYIRSCA